MLVVDADAGIQYVEVVQLLHRAITTGVDGD